MGSWDAFLFLVLQKGGDVWEEERIRGLLMKMLDDIAIIV